MTYRNQQVAHTLESQALLGSTGQVIAAGTDDFVEFAFGTTELTFTTTKPGQHIIVLLALTRQNSSAAGAGRYECWINDADLTDIDDLAIAITNDQEQSTLVGYQRIVMPTAGDFTLKIRGFAFTGNETLANPQSLILLGPY